MYNLKTLYIYISRDFDLRLSIWSKFFKNYGSKKLILCFEVGSRTQQSALELNEINVSKHVVTYSPEGRRRNSKPLKKRGTSSTAWSSTVPYSPEESTNVARAFIRHGTRREKRIVWISRYANVKTLEVSWANVELTGKESCKAYPARFATYKVFPDQARKKKQFCIIQRLWCRHYHHAWRRPLPLLSSLKRENGT